MGRFGPFEVRERLRGSHWRPLIEGWYPHHDFQA
jgi:hypothetical protein